MSPELSEMQRLFLWRIIAGGGEEWLKHVKPSLDTRKRNSLVQAGLVETERRRDPDTNGVGLHVRVLDAGWDWAARNMDATLPTRSTAGSLVLQLILARLRGFLAERNLDLATILGPSVRAADLSDRIADACMKLGGGRANVRVRLADLRRQLPDVAREDLDTMLLQMSRDHTLTLYRLDNPAEVQAEDRAAALVTASGEPRHIVYLG